MPTPTRLTVAAVSTVPFPSLTLTGDESAIREAAALLGKPVDVTDSEAVAAAQEDAPNARRAATMRALDLLERFGFASATLSISRNYVSGDFSASCEVQNGNEFRAVFAGRPATARSGGHGWATAIVTVDGVEFSAGWIHSKVKFELSDWIVGSPLPSEEPLAPTEAPADAAPVAADDADVVF